MAVSSSCLGTLCLLTAAVSGCGGVILSLYVAE
jgi:hypothetical protein